MFDADRIPDTESTSRELVAWLTGDDPTFALAAAWRLCASDQFDTTTLEALHAATHASDPDVVPVVIGLLAGADERDEKTVGRVTALLRDRRPTVALAAAKAAYALGLDLKDQMGTLAWLLDKYKQEPFEVLTIIAAQGPSASAIDGTLCHMLPRSFKSLNDDLTLALVNCLRSISDNPKQSIESCLTAGPIREEAIQWLQRSG